MRYLTYWKGNMAKHYEKKNRQGFLWTALSKKAHFMIKYPICSPFLSDIIRKLLITLRIQT